MAGIITKAPPIPTSDPNMPAATPVMLVMEMVYDGWEGPPPSHQSINWFVESNVSTPNESIHHAPIAPALAARAPSTPPAPLPPAPPPLPDDGGAAGVEAGGLLLLLLVFGGGVVVRPLLPPFDRTAKPSPADDNSSPDFGRARPASVAIEADTELLHVDGASGRLPARAAPAASSSPCWCARRQPLAADWSILDSVD